MAYVRVASSCKFLDSVCEVPDEFSRFPFAAVERGSVFVFHVFSHETFFESSIEGFIAGCLDCVIELVLFNEVSGWIRLFRSETLNFFFILRNRQCLRYSRNALAKS